MKICYFLDSEELLYFFHVVFHIIIKTHNPCGTTLNCYFHELPLLNSYGVATNLAKDLNIGGKKLSQYTMSRRDMCVYL